MKKLLLFLVLILVITMTGCDKIDNREVERVMFNCYLDKDRNTVEITDQEDIKELRKLYLEGKKEIKNDHEERELIGKIVFEYKDSDETTTITVARENDDDCVLDIKGGSVYHCNDNHMDIFKNIGKKYDLYDVNYKYKAATFEESKITEITISDLGQYSSPKKLSSKEDIKKLYSILKNKKTNTPSTDVNPENPDELFVINFFLTDGVDQVYIFRRDNKYYIERTFDGIYESYKEDFDLVKKMFNK